MNIILGNQGETYNKDGLSYQYETKSKSFDFSPTRI